MFFICFCFDTRSCLLVLPPLPEHAPGHAELIMIFSVLRTNKKIHVMSWSRHAGSPTNFIHATHLEQGYPQKHTAECCIPACLSCSEVTSQIMKPIRSFHDRTQAHVRLNDDELSQWLYTLQGLTQGCVWCLTLFWGRNWSTWPSTDERQTPPSSQT